MDKLFILEKLIEDPKLSQSSLSKKCGLSLGKCNYLLSELEELGYLRVDREGKNFTYHVTSSGKEYCKRELEILHNLKIPNERYLNYEKPKTAVILAAGYKKGFDTPISLIPISEEETIIDRTIRILEKNGIEQFIVVSGYQGHLFDHSAIANKSNVQFIENTEFQWTGTMYSLSLTVPYIQNDFILLEDDILIEEKVLQNFLEYPFSDCLLLSKEGGSGEETYVEIRNDSVFRISKEIQQFNSVDGELIGISKISKDFLDQMIQTFASNKNQYQGYEYAMMDVGRKQKLNYYKPIDFIWGEIDTKSQMKVVLGKIYSQILEKEKREFEKEAIEVFAKIMNCQASDIAEIRRLGGLTNKNYCIVLDDKEYAFRIPGSGTEKIINRNEEGQNAKIACQAGVDADLVYFDYETGIKIAHMIENPVTLNAKLAKKAGNIKMVAELFRKLHTSGLEMVNRFDPFEKMDEYEGLIRQANVKMFDGFEDIKNQVMDMRERYAQFKVQLVPCHNDALPENFIISGKDKMYLIDWEYSGMNDPMWDVAAFCLECGFSEKEENLLLKEYLQTKNISDEHKEWALMNKIFQDFLWSMWAVQMELEGADYGTYAQDRFSRGKENIELYNQLFKGENN